MQMTLSTLHSVHLPRSRCCILHIANVLLDQQSPIEVSAFIIGKIHHMYLELEVRRPTS